MISAGWGNVQSLHEGSDTCDEGMKTPVSLVKICRYHGLISMHHQVRHLLPVCRLSTFHSYLRFWDLLGLSGGLLIQSCDFQASIAELDNLLDFCSLSNLSWTLLSH